MRLPVKRIFPLAVIVLVSACGGGGEGHVAALPATPAAGPAADYPVVLGDAFTIESTSYTPTDKLNYDAVGQASVGSDRGAGVTGAHKTLPLPSYVEVTELETGKTILVRLERRGPMVNDRLIELSPGAAAQLGIEGRDKAPVRVRRVNPPEPERAALRSGQRAPERMETPKSLLAVLMRRLDPTGAPTALTAAPAPRPSEARTPAITSPPKPPANARPATAPNPAVAPVAATAPAPPVPVHGGLFVQVATMSTRERADAVATAVGGEVAQSGRFWRVRMGPFPSRHEASAALAKARSSGYRDATIQRAD